MRFSLRTLQADIDAFRSGNQDFPGLFDWEDFLPLEPADVAAVEAGKEEEQGWRYRPSAGRFYRRATRRLPDGRRAVRVNETWRWVPEGAFLTEEQVRIILLFLRYAQGDTQKKLAKARQEKKKARARARDWMVGKQFGALIVEARTTDPENPTHPFMVCLCTCGRPSCKGKVRVRWDSLRRRQTKTCRLAKQA